MSKTKVEFNTNCKMAREFDRRTHSCDPNEPFSCNNPNCKTEPYCISTCTTCPFHRKAILKKLDTAGNFLEFPGVTVVADLAGNTLDEAFSRLSETKAFTKNYALLPKSSYHMTFYNIQTEKSLVYSESMTWPYYKTLNRSNFEKIKLDLEKSFPESSVRGHIVCHEMGGVLLLLVHLELPYVRRVLEYGKILFQDILPEKDWESKFEVDFHVTLAYRIPGATGDCKKEVDKVFQELKLNGTEVEFHPPKICLFDSMLEFIPLE